MPFPNLYSLRPKFPLFIERGVKGIDLAISHNLHCGRREIMTVNGDEVIREAFA